jgi:hypothetical protein
MHYFSDVKGIAEIFYFLIDRTFKITGMNPKANFGVHTLRLAGCFNLPIPIRFAPHPPVFAFVIGVSPQIFQQFF